MLKESLILIGILFWSLSARGQHFHQELYDYLDAKDHFPFGVASGEPSTSSIVLWTKIVPDREGEYKIGWKIATDSSMFNVLQSGQGLASAENAYSVSKKVMSLPPGKKLYYQFNIGQELSPVGRTKTNAVDPSMVKLAVVSCSDYQTGHFNAYAHIATRSDIDVVVHLGDYIYETSSEKWGPGKQRKQMYRSHLPDHVLVTLKDYRTRYAQYRLDPALQEAHRLHPFVVVWDDHEFSNNAHSELASPAQVERRRAARQAYLEWMPLDISASLPIYRRINFGSMADLWMLDTRQEGRMEQAENEQDLRWQDSSRTMLGSDQRDWLTKGMANSSARWQILGNQVIFTPMHDSRVFSRVPAIKMDRWDGYPAARSKLFRHWRNHQIENIIVLTGDVHTAWAFDLTENPLDPNWYNPKTGEGSIGAEFITPSVSAFNFNNILPRPLAWEAERRLKKNKYNPHLHYLDLVRHGYLVTTFTKEEASAEWLFFNPKRSTTKVQQSRQHIYRWTD